ncbi:hypothetical protein [Sphingomonas oligophenolica]|uniref:hypothetical protein n=1 Tax=Sphingomonas oligophenolica TaxID=301154 RepID=UPI0014771101|nr:hypothetical protein [Sphingomonas oligophenolica]
MNSNKTRLVLQSTVSTAAAVFFLPASAQAQATTCSQTGTTIRVASTGSGTVDAAHP